MDFCINFVNIRKFLARLRVFVAAAVLGYGIRVIVRRSNVLDMKWMKNARWMTKEFGLLIFYLKNSVQIITSKINEITSNQIYKLTQNFTT